jgi:hypothetical protein
VPPVMASGAFAFMSTVIVAGSVGALEAGAAVAGALAAPESDGAGALAAGGAALVGLGVGWAFAAKELTNKGSTRAVTTVTRRRIRDSPSVFSMTETRGGPFARYSLHPESRAPVYVRGHSLGNCARPPCPHSPAAEPALPVSKLDQGRRQPRPTAAPAATPQKVPSVQHRLGVWGRGKNGHWKYLGRMSEDRIHPVVRPILHGSAIPCGAGLAWAKAEHD